MSIWRKFALFLYPTLLTAALAGLALLAWTSLSRLAPAQTTAAQAGALGLLILVWLGAFVRLRRRYLWLALHPDEEPPHLRVLQWLEVTLGALALAAATGLLSVAGLLLWRGALENGDPWRGAPVALAALAALLAGYLLRGSCRRANARRADGAGLRLAAQHSTDGGQLDSEAPPHAS